MAANTFNYNLNLAQRLGGSRKGPTGASSLRWLLYHRHNTKTISYDDMHWYKNLNLTGISKERCFPFNFSYIDI